MDRGDYWSMVRASIALLPGIQVSFCLTVSFMREILYRNPKMEAFAAGADTGGARGAIFKQMAEMKKKIQLVEGERKAVFEDCEREKEENKEKIKKLELEIKQIKQEVKSALHKLL